MSVGNYKCSVAYINVGGDLLMLWGIYTCHMGFINIAGDL